MSMTSPNFSNRSKSVLTGICLVLLLLFLYCLSSYNSVFDQRVAYIYHPSSDRIFKIKIVPSINKYNKWEPFIPFHSLSYSEVDEVHYIGTLHNALKEIQADQELLKDNPKEWNKKKRLEIETELQKVKDGNLEFFDIKYFVRRDIVPETLLPDSISSLSKYSKENPLNLLVVDAFVIRWTMTEKRPELELLECALLIKNRAAYEVSDRGL